VKLNRALCQLAEHMAELKGAAPKVIDAEIVEAAGRRVDYPKRRERSIPAVAVKRGSMIA